MAKNKTGKDKFTLGKLITSILGILEGLIFL